MAQLEVFLMNIYSNYVQIFTDASKIGIKVGVAYVIPKLRVVEKKRISDNLAVFTGELVAIRLALLWVESCRPNRVAIWSDSSSVLISLQGMHSGSRPDIVYEILHLQSRLQKSGIRITLGWVPAHVGVVGNEAADKYAKQAIKQEIELNISYSKAEVKCIIKEKVKGIWQYMWDEESTGSHQEEGMVTRMRIGHTGLNSTLALVNKHTDGLCECKSSQETVEHYTTMPTIPSATKHISQTATEGKGFFRHHRHSAKKFW